MTAAPPASADAPGRATPTDLARAFGVVFGGSAVLDAAACAAVVATARAAARRTRPPRWALAGAGLLALYAVAGRPWVLGWGSTPEERAAALPGDEMVPDPSSQSTRAATIDAPVEAVWPWVAQIGQDRGGFYSYEWLENLAGCRMRNAQSIHPEWQRRAIGETVLLHPLHGLPVVRFEPERVLTLKGWGSWVLEPLPRGRTRLLLRSRTGKGPEAILGPLLVEVPHFVMERAMLLGIKRRAERHAPVRRSGWRPRRRRPFPARR